MFLVLIFLSPFLMCVPPPLPLSFFLSLHDFRQVYDMPMLRFEPSASCQYAASNNNGDGDDHDHDVSDPVFVRGEGTIARFFSIEAARSLFESVGFDTLELRYCTVYNRNRKTGQEMKRVFVHGVFRKPHHPPGA